MQNVKEIRIGFFEIGTDARCGSEQLVGDGSDPRASHTERERGNFAGVAEGPITGVLAGLNSHAATGCMAGTMFQPRSGHKRASTARIGATASRAASHNEPDPHTITLDASQTANMPFTTIAIRRKAERVVISTAQFCILSFAFRISSSVDGARSTSMPRHFCCRNRTTVNAHRVM